MLKRLKNFKSAHNTWTMINICMNKSNNENITKYKY